MKRLALIATLAILAFFVAIPAASAVTDLNNIPITDTLEAGTLEWDLTVKYNEDFARGRSIDTRLFGALFENFEFGMSWGISRPAGPFKLSLKYKVLDEYGGGLPVSVAVGAEGITGNYERTGMDPTYYGVIGRHDVRLVGLWDWYVGYYYTPTEISTPDYVADSDSSVFGGFKYWINDDLQFNADYWGYHEMEEYIIAGGLNYDWVNHIGIQGWVEHDSGAAGGDGDTFFVLQLVARADMRDLTAEVSDPE